MGFDWSRMMGWLLAVGLFIQLSGKIWLVSGSARNSQIYIWLLLPALVFSLSRILVKHRFKIDLQYLPWLLFLLWVALSTLWATGIESSVQSIAKRALFVGLYLVAINVLINQHESYFRRVLLASVVVIAFGALLSLIYQYGVLEKPIAYRAFRIDRMGIGEFANFGWPVAAGIFYGSVAMWAMGMVLDSRTSTKLALFWLAVFTILALYVLMTGTRGAWIALLGSCVLAVVMQRSRRGIWGMGLCLVAVAVISAFLWDQILVEVQKRQLSGRGPIWAYYFDVMSGHWWLGHGFGTPFTYLWPNGKTISPHAHSLYLQQIYDSGLISLGFLLSGLAVLFYKGWIMRHNSWVRLTFPVLVYALIAMLTDVERVITRPSDYWTVFWLPVAVLLALPYKKLSKQE
ncbi:O-antigen ligase family protein [Pseudomonas sp. xss_2]|uniref:O-antigen ligase family protein n=1 Tax=Pseudomonas sp. xss_2 TaxID=3367215 RepID=UPI00370ACF3F